MQPTAPTQSRARAPRLMTDLEPHTRSQTIFRNIWMKKRNRFPPGWNDARVQRVLDHYEAQSDIEAVAEDEAAYRSTTTTVMKIPVKLVPAVRALLAKRRAS